VLTKASELPLQPRCRLPDGRVAEGRVVGAEPAFDLALLKVDAADLRPITWADSFNPVAGTLLAAPGREELPLAVGIVSVPRRELAAKVPNHGLPLRVPAEPPEIRGPENFGKTDPQGGEGGYLVHTSEGLAFSAGIRAGDRVATLAGRPVRGFDDLAEGVKARLSGDLVSVALSRDGKTIELLLPLAAGALYHNFRNEDFPIVFEHSVPLFAHESGGPVVDLSGRAVGVTIARVEQHGCLAIPGDVVRRLLPSLQSGKLAGNWHSPAGARVPHSP
jgi:S1-C subfamily serine protease